MKKNLKKIIFILGFTTVTTMANADIFHITCDNGNEFNYISFEEVGSDEEMEDLEQAINDLCA